ncbi:MAG: sulfatase [Planctomycetota bacterium]
MALMNCFRFLVATVFATPLFTLPVQPVVARQPETTPPNVILIVIDDLGWADLGLNGSTFYETPNIDSLAADGAFLSSAYAASPICSPTRASIFSGKYPSRIGMSYLAGVRGPFGPQHRMIPPEVTGHLPDEDVTLAEAFKEAGYSTAHIGKWHLHPHGDRGNAHYPDKHGFDLNIAGSQAGQPGSYFYPYENERHPAFNVRGLEDGSEGDYLTDVVTDRAIGFIEEHDKEPFFLSMCYFTVHTPIQPREDKLQKYREKAEAAGFQQNERHAVQEFRSMTHSRQDNPAYASMVESMDENVGRLLQALDQSRIGDNTIVVFFSDNGGLSTGRGPNAPTSNLPLRAGKAWIYEGGIRVPMIVRFPGSVQPGLRNDTPIISNDIYPTLLELAGLPLRPQQHVDGVSLKSLLSGERESLDREAIFFHMPHYHHINSMGPSAAVRCGDYKLVEIMETGEIELYNLANDIGEQNNLAADEPELAERLTTMLHQWQQNSGAQPAIENPDYRQENDWRNEH